MTAKIGIAQIGSVHLDLEKSLAKMSEIVAKATAEGVQLLVFGETWLSGYPAWIDFCPDVARWDYEPMKEAFLKLYKSSISIPGKEFDFLSALARENKITLCIGINEHVESGPGNGTLFNSVVIIGSDGTLLNHHRKLMPTYTEKMLYGVGDGAGLRSVKTEFGRISASICWEHWMPLTRQTLHDSGEHIHIALWPTVNEMHQVASRHYAFEGRCFVIAVGQMLTAKDFPKDLKLPDDISKEPDQWILRGGSCVIDPTGKFIVAPIFDKEELIVVEVDTDNALKERMTLDTTGHYQRNDIFELKINRSRR